LIFQSIYWESSIQNSLRSVGKDWVLLEQDLRVTLPNCPGAAEELYLGPMHARLLFCFSDSEQSPVHLSSHLLFSKIGVPR
jgi:hypothetical protein